MTDRELLELAAKAAGLKHVDYTGVDYDGRLGIVLVDDIGRHCGEFSPLTDDGDALRLAVVLAMLVSVDTCYYATVCKDEVSVVEHIGNNGYGCIYAATRRAIVRAAAEIGKAMQ